MGDTHHDPTDHFRTTHQHAGESLIDVYFWPGLFLVAVGAVAFIASVATMAYGRYEWLAIAVTAAAAATVIGALAIHLERRRIRRIETRWWAEHPVLQSVPKL